MKVSEIKKGVACPVCSGEIEKPDPKPELKLDLEVLKNITR